MMRARNLSSFERWASGTIGSMLATWGLRRGGILGLAGVAGAAAFILRASSGRCAMKAALAAPEDTRLDPASRRPSTPQPVRRVPSGPSSNWT